jgi:RNA recognition motif-containing protein
MCGGRVIFQFFFYPPEGLRNYFSEFGKVDACTIVRDADGKSRGFAFLTFEDPASVNAVMVREHFLDGKAVRVLHPSTSPTFSDKCPFFVTDRPQTRDSTGGTPAKHPVLCWWLSAADNGGNHAFILFQIWKSRRCHGHGRP